MIDFHSSLVQWSQHYLFANAMYGKRTLQNSDENSPKILLEILNLQDKINQIKIKFMKRLIR